MDNMILYEDNVLLVVHKPAGIATETSKIGQADLVSELKNYRRTKGEDTFIGVVHRLDQPVEGLLVFAKNAHTAGKLSKSLQEGNIIKKYVALTAGVPKAPNGILTDFLTKDGRTNLSRVVPADLQGRKRHRFSGSFWRTTISSLLLKSNCSPEDIIRFGCRWHMRVFHCWVILNMVLRRQRTYRKNFRFIIQRFWHISYA